MMHVFPATFITPTNRAGGVRVIFEIDDSNRESAGELIKLPMGKEMLLVAYEIGEDSEDIRKAHVKPDYGKNQFMKQVHAIIGDYAAQTGVGKDKIKNILRLKLIAKNYIKESMSEANEQTMATAVYILRTQMNPSRLDYTDYQDNET